MNLKLLIDGIVRQTTVLIAQISTSSGVRAPLAHVADQVFFELAREIEAQGVRRRVAADMFGMALRAYQKKTQRLTESATARDRTLWEAMLSFIGGGETTRSRIGERFKHDGAREVGAVLSDLVRSGLVYQTGSGEHAIFGLTRDDVRDRILHRADLDSLANVVWLKVFRGEAQSRAELAAGLPAEPGDVDRAVDELIASGRLIQRGAELESANVVLPLGGDQGWEAAILDHYRAVAVAIATKIRGGFSSAHERDRVGGSTFTFTVEAGHPHAAEVYDLLRDTRLRAQALWDKVASHNEAHTPGEDADRVTFYVGQSLEQHGGDGDRDGDLDTSGRGGDEASEERT
jgi:hypothetical protein